MHVNYRPNDNNGHGLMHKRDPRLSLYALHILKELSYKQPSDSIDVNFILFNQQQYQHMKRTIQEL